MCEHLVINDINSSLFDADTIDSYNLTAESFAEELAYVLTYYYTPGLVFLGTIGNLISILVFFTSKLRVQPTSQYLSALALSDTLFLFQLLPPWLNGLQISPVFNRPGFCQLFIYLLYVTCCLSAWLVVAFTIERLMAVLYPLKRNAWCTVARARIIILVLALAAALINLPVLQFAETRDNNCTINPEYMRFASRFNIVDTTLAFTIPLVIIVILNTWIMVGVWRLERERRELARFEESEDGFVRRSTRPRPAIYVRSQQRVTRMLLIVSSVFVLLNLPAYTMRVVTYYAFNVNSEEYQSQWDALQQVASMFFNTNFGINFFLYCLSGQNFREELRNSTPCLRNRKGRAVGRRATLAMHTNRASTYSASFASYNTEAMSSYGASTEVPDPTRQESTRYNANLQCANQTCTGNVLLHHQEPSTSPLTSPKSVQPSSSNNLGTIKLNFFSGIMNSKTLF